MGQPVHAAGIPSEQPPEATASWIPSVDDILIVDTKENTGYLVHTDGSFTEFAVATGQRRIVRYIGRTYDARTPERRWNILSSEVKGDRTTFGKRGIFLRLHDFATGEETAYGVHSHRSADAMLSAPGNERYRSMGCIIVADDILDLIQTTWTLNGNAMTVITRNGIPADIPAIADTYRHPGEGTLSL
jgi:hypothetical protein